jgi:DNA replication and repair protein RecF
MYLESIFLENFKNYQKEKFEFLEGINCVVGENGSGKTNLLDAIHMSAFTKSAFNYIDQDLILNEQDYFKIVANIENAKSDKVEIRLKSKEKKQVFWNDNPYEKLSEHIGKIPLVLINPNDTDLIRQGGEIRRRFFDSLLSVLDKNYLSDLSKYQKTLRQRNNLLKQMSESGKTDKTLIEVYNETLLELNASIGIKRKSFIDTYSKKFEDIHAEIADGDSIKWKYQSNCLDANFKEKFVKNFDRDLYLQRTNMGIHKDDYEFDINDISVKKYASQGQQKSCVLALKIIQFIAFKEHFKSAPILLLDDIFDKLDSGRMSRLIKIISEQDFNQIFVTDAHPERSIEIFKNTGAKFRIFEIQEGTLKNVE